MLSTFMLHRLLPVQTHDAREIKPPQWDIGWRPQKTCPLTDVLVLDEHVDAQVIGLVVHERRPQKTGARLLGGL
jgi:hypothetical protein